MKIVPTLLAGLTAATLLHADAPPTNPLALADGKLVFEVQERVRLEIRDNNFDFNEAVNARTDDSYLLQRFRLGLLARPTDWLLVYAQGQDSREIGSDRSGVPFVTGAEGDDTFDLRQAWVEIGNAAECPWSLKLGRQELSYGDERLIGAFDWNNFARTFDALKVRYADTEHKFWADAFAARVVNITDFGPAGNYGWQFNDADGNDNFAGLYAGTTRLRFQTTEAYFLYRDKDDSNPLYTDAAGNTARAYDLRQEIYTTGLRLKSTPGQLRGFDYELEGAYQWGRAGNLMLDHHAFAAAARAGYTWTNCTWQPRLGFEYAVASGDQSGTDQSSDSFLNLFPTNHKFYGYMDFFAWKNIHNLAGQLKLAPHKKVSVQVDYHASWLYTNEDAWYRANGVATVRPVSPTADRFVGTEVDLTIGYNPKEWLRVLAGYSHFFRGDYLQNTGADDDADFGYVQTVISF
jgi:hypothetical protein